MAKIFKALGILAAVLAATAAALVGYVALALPNVGPAPELQVDRSTEAVERGRYLANAVMACMDCHSTRDWQRFAGPPLPGTLGKGGERFGPEMGFPGVFHAPNITPAALATWTDGEIYRAVTAGVGRDGRALFPVMPYPDYGRLETKDIHAVIAYLRSLPPIPNAVEASKPAFPMSLIVNTIPKAPSHALRADRSDVVRYGEYVATAAVCKECHTRQEQGQPVPGMEYAGGFEFGFPDGSTARSLNITPDPATGIGEWSEEFFVKRFKAYADPGSEPPKVLEVGRQTPMPWLIYAHMTEEDLRAIYAYLRTVPPRRSSVVVFTPAP